MRHAGAILNLGLLLSGCATRSEFANLPEPYRATFTKEIREQPSYIFSKACHGDPKALHSYFIQANEPLDGAAGEGFTASIIAIKSYMGNDAFYAAIRKEPYDIQKAMHDYMPDFIPRKSTEQGAAANP